MTQDVDSTILTGYGNEESFIEKLLSAFPSRISNAMEFGIQNRVLLVTSSNGISMDVTLAALPFEFNRIARATPFEYAPGCSLIT